MDSHYNLLSVLCSELKQLPSVSQDQLNNWYISGLYLSINPFFKNLYFLEFSGLQLVPQQWHLSLFLWKPYGLKTIDHILEVVKQPKYFQFHFFFFRKCHTCSFLPGVIYPHSTARRNKVHSLWNQSCKICQWKGRAEDRGHQQCSCIPHTEEWKRTRKNKMFRV